MSDARTPTRSDTLPVPDTTGPTPDAAVDPLPPPVWAIRGIPEDGGITHETVSRLQPLVRIWHDSGPAALHPTEVGLSVVDLLIDGRWIRAEPTVQVEAGSYPMESVRQLHDALDELLHAVHNAGTGTEHLPTV